jgi:ABC-type branched-subunit amino acid transport system substrate-binding protein
MADSKSSNKPPGVDGNGRMVTMRIVLSTIFVASILMSGCKQSRPVGFVAGMSGPTSEQGITERDGARLYVESRGRRLVTCDSKTDPVTVARCVDNLADSGVRVVIGPMYSSEAESALAAATRRGVLLMAPSVSTHRLSGKDDALIRVIGSNLDEADTLANFLLKRRIARPVLVWTRLNEAYLHPMVDRICSSFVGRKLSKPAVFEYASSLDLDFDSVVASHPDADAFVSLGTPMEAALLARAVRRSGSLALLVGCQSSVGKDLLRMGGKDAEGAILTAFTELVDRVPERIRFASDFRTRFGRDRSWAATLGWEAAAVSEPGWDSDNLADAKKAILRDDTLRPLGLPILLDRYGDIHRTIALHEVRGGKIELLRQPAGGL